jgi:two-component system chemotaxis response regulator CheB
LAHENQTPAREIVLIGGSAGGIEALISVVRGLPADFPASILVTIHVSPHAPSMLPAILARAGKLPARHAVEGETLLPGTIFVAPPDHHLVLGERDTLHVRRGPRENGHRPAIDSLFRSAPVHGYSARCVGVVLSGYLDDGAAGLYALRSRGGLAIVQDPATASAPDMPSNALAFTGADFVLPPAEIAPRLVQLLDEPGKVVAMPAKMTAKSRKRRRSAPARNGRNAKPTGCSLVRQLMTPALQAGG